MATRVLDVVLRLRRVISVLLHALLVVAANMSAFWLRFDGEVPGLYAAMAQSLLPALVLIRLMVFIPFRLFEGLWRYTGLWDLWRILLGVGVSTIVFYPITLINPGSVGYPRSIYIIDAVLLICMMSGVRLTRRMYSEVLVPTGHRRVLCTAPAMRGR